MKTIKYYIFLISVLAYSPAVFGQHHTIKGRVIAMPSGITLTGAFVHWMDKSSGVYADKNGNFEIKHGEERPYLVAAYVGHKTDTFAITDMDSFYALQLYPDAMLEGTTVIAKRITYGISRMDPKTTINLSEREFQKAACCNLSESFENAPAIDVNFGDAITGTRQIKMLGLDGFYTLFSREYMPSVRLLNSYYGMSFIPSAWVKSLQITKGAGSIVNGYESIAGQINIEMKKPFDLDKVMVDQFISEAGRSETDLMYKWDVSQHVATSAFARLALYPLQQDRNNDGFLDNPTGRQFGFMNRWQFYTDNQYEGQFNASYNNDIKDAGQMDYYAENKQDFYGVEIKNEQWDLWSKVGKVFPDKPYKSLGSQFGVNGSSIESSYGSSLNSRLYKANAVSYYANLMHESIIWNTFHKLKTGFSFMGDQLKEDFDSLHFDRDEMVPGVFMEYTYSPDEHFNLVWGLRSDYNSIYGFTITPRFHGKYRFNKDKTALRASAGMGRHTANILAQNQHIFASQRTIVVESSGDGAYGLEQELAFNTGLSFEHDFKLGYIPSGIFIDFFHSAFYREVVLDRETAMQARFYNMDNGTRSNSFQFQLDLNPLRRTDIRLAYRLFDVSALYRIDDYLVRLNKPFISRHRTFVNITRNTKNRWQFSSTLQWYGPQRIAGQFKSKTIENNHLILEPKMSPYFFQLGAQASKRFKKPFEVFMGIENILNYRQNNPIESSADPFQPEFDAGMVWGPVFGRMVYGGFRYRLNVAHDETD